MRDPTGSEAHCTTKNNEGVGQESQAVQRTNLRDCSFEKKESSV